MAEWYIASCQISVALISLRSTLAFSAVSLALLADVASSAAPSSAGAAATAWSSDAASSRRIVRSTGAHHRRHASPEDAIPTLREAGTAFVGSAVAAIGPRRRIRGAEVGAIGGRERVAMDGTGIGMR